MARRYDIKELVHLLDGPEKRPVEYRFGTRQFLGRLRSPGAFENPLTYSQAYPQRSFDSLVDNFWSHDNSFPFWRRAGIGSDLFWSE